jgi:hypothetical protein
VKAETGVIIPSEILEEFRYINECKGSYEKG